MANYAIWTGIIFCLSQSAMFSGLNLACFSVSRLRLEIEVANGNAAAQKVLQLRKDSNFLLATVLWGNVAINVLLTLFSNSVMIGATAFLFSTFVITIGGEILPQAYFSRNALRMASLLSPLLRMYQILLYIIAKPTGLMLDMWLGEEGIQYFRERDLRQLIHKHIDSVDTDVSALEGIGALNFLAIDDVPVTGEGEAVAAESIISLPVENGRPVFFSADSAERQQRDFIQRLAAIRYRWVILVDQEGYPLRVLDSSDYLRQAHLASSKQLDPCDFCHIPVVITDPSTRLGTVISFFKNKSAAQSDSPLVEDVVLLWGSEKRIITGVDILGRLFQGIGLHSALDGQRTEHK